MYQITKIISVLFHPLWMPIIIYSTLRFFIPHSYHLSKADTYVFPILGLNIIISILSIYILKRKKTISTFEMPKQKERVIPYALVLSYYILSLVFLYFQKNYTPYIVSSFFMMVIMSLFVALIINQYWKISVHMIAIGGLFGTLLGLNSTYAKVDTTYFTLAIGIASYVAFSRLYLSAHSPLQVYVGFLIGSIIGRYYIGG